MASCGGQAARRMLRSDILRIQRFTRFIAFLVASFAIVGNATAAADIKPFGEKHTSYDGFDRYDFTVDGRSALVVLPKKTIDGNPWIWRAEFFDHQPQIDLALLEKGFHLA